MEKEKITQIVSILEKQGYGKENIIEYIRELIRLYDTDDEIYEKLNTFVMDKEELNNESFIKLNHELFIEGISLLKGMTVSPSIEYSEKDNFIFKEYIKNN